MKKYSIRFIYTLVCALSVLLLSAIFANAALVGDVDANGEIKATDARFILRASVGLETLTEEQFLLADSDENGKISALDARFALRASVGLEEIRHYYAKELINEATCTEPDKYLYTCTECDDSYEVTGNALGHDFPEPEILIQVTCESDGLEKYTCNRCDFSEEKVVTGGHIWDREAPTCTEDKFCTRGNHIAENGKKIGHTTDWDMCGNCNQFVTDRHSDAAAIIKTKTSEAISATDTAYKFMEETIGAASWSVIRAKSAKPYYVQAKTAFEEALAACGDIPEFAAIKAALITNISNLDKILAQVEIIITTPNLYIDANNYYQYTDPIFEAHILNNNSIVDTNKIINKAVKW